MAYAVRQYSICRDVCLTVTFSLENDASFMSITSDV